MISQSTIQQILTKIDIIGVIGTFVKLKKRGSSYLGLCPFHHEKTPSFTVSASKEIYKCFGCGKSGNTVSFLMEHEKYSYVEAIRWLAQLYGVPMEETALSPEAKAEQLEADSLFIVNNFARDFFRAQLEHTDEGRQVGLSYFQERGFSAESIEKFQLGYCPGGSSAFYEAAQAKGYQTDYLLKTGLVSMRNDKGLDTYRGRVIFPVHNQSGKVTGFGARILGRSERSPKYINTPENRIFFKSRLLYGLYQARHAIDRADECLLVEGYTDVISLHQAGIENVVASSGTSLTTEQLRLIKKYTNNITILYDGDKAGVKAALRGLDMAIEEGLSVKLALIPDGEDPDSYVGKIGADAFRNFIVENKEDFILFRLRVSLEEAGNDPAKRSELVNEIARTISRIDRVQDFTRQQDYVRLCSQILKIDEQGMTTLVNQYIREQGPAPKAAIAPQSLFSPDEKQEQALVRILLRFGALPFAFAGRPDGTVAEYIFNLPCEFDQLADSLPVRRILQEYKSAFEEGEILGEKWFLYHADPAIGQLVTEILEDREGALSENWKDRFDIETACGEDVYRNDTISTTNYLMLRKIKKLMLENQEELCGAQDEDDYLRCIQMHQHLKQMEMEITQGVGTVIQTR